MPELVDGSALRPEWVPGDEPAQLVQSEAAYIAKRRDHLQIGGVAVGQAQAVDNAQQQATVGLALSGGGIRSATFCAGVLQYFAAQGLLKHIDYLSTVSGGGYIGSSLTWFLQGNHGLGTFDVGSGFPYGTDSPDRRKTPPPAENPNLVYLRNRGRFLTPGKGVTALSMVAVVLRGVVLNFLVWVPIVTFLFLTYMRAKNDSGRIGDFDWWSARLRAFAQAVDPGALVDFGGWKSTIAHLGTTRVDPRTIAPNFFFSELLALAAVIFALFVLGSILYSLSTYAAFDRLGAKRADYFRYFGRRLFEKVGHYAVGGIAFLVVVGSIPLAAWYLGNKLSGGIFLSGALSSAATFLRSRSGEARGLVAMDRIAPIAASLLLYGFGLMCFLFAVEVYGNGVRGAEATHLQKVFALLMIVAFATGVVVNLNMTTLHRFYRDRLMEAFLPDMRKRCGGIAMAADRFYLCHLAYPPFDAAPVADAEKGCWKVLSRWVTKRRGPAPEPPRGPYHLINTHHIIVNSADPKLKRRGGDSFILSPHYCGSATTGWKRTDKYMATLSLPTAMAISGAAVNPEAGVGGVGFTRSRSVAFIMGLLNLRLGYWMPNPSRTNVLLRRCNHFYPGFSTVFPIDDTKHHWVQLSDGGHFDNTGVYELLRRRTKLIFLCDGGADPKYKFEDLNNMIRRAYEDFRTVIEFPRYADLRCDLDFLMPGQDNCKYPLDMLLSERAFAAATIRYPDGDSGTLIYMTTTVTRDVSMALLSYKDSHRLFPDEPTLDQFFAEDQFEAYRELGWIVAELTMNGTQVRSVPVGAGPNPKHWLVCGRPTPPPPSKGA